MLVFLRVIIPTIVTRYRIGAIKSKSTRIGAITVFIQKYIPVSYSPYIVHTNATQIVNIRLNLDILFRFLIYKPTKIAAGIIAVPGSDAIKTIGKNNISSIHLPHWQPNSLAQRPPERKAQREPNSLAIGRSDGANC